MKDAKTAKKRGKKTILAVVCLVAAGIAGLVYFTRQEQERARDARPKPLEEKTSRPALAEPARQAQITRVAVAAPQPGETMTIPLGGNVNMEVVWVPPDEFVMGSNTGDSDEKPSHTVKISQGFWMGKYEVTNEQYQQFLRDSGYNGKKDADSDYLRHHRDWNKYASTENQYPIVTVSWKNAEAFCKWMTRKCSGRSMSGSLRERTIVRLPTEAEWEYACRAGTSTKYYTGNGVSDLARAGWYSSNSGSKTHPVGKKVPNKFGLYDMHGNVWEWCEDWYDKDYYGQSPEKDPKGPVTGKQRVLRGGSWGYNAWFCRSALRVRYAPTFTWSFGGIRVVVLVAGAE